MYGIVLLYVRWIHLEGREEVVGPDPRDNALHQRVHRPGVRLQRG
jgi:hypothetical protein